MTKETKNTVAAETIVENLKKFATELHQLAHEGMIDSVFEKDEDAFVLANITHDISHGLIDILQGESADEALKNVFGDDEDDTPDVGSISVNLKTGDVKCIEDIKNQKLKEQKKKRLKREKKQLINAIDFLENSFTKAAKQMRLEYDKMPFSNDKIHHDFFIAGFEFCVEQLAIAKDIVSEIDEV